MNLSKRHLILNLFTLLLFCSTHAQLYNVETIKTLNNNGSASVKKLLYLDKNGFLWYSTLNGIVKELGNDRQLFPFNLPKNVQNVNVTFAIHTTSQQEVWSLTYLGINILDLKTGLSKWVELKYPGTNKTVSFCSIKEDNNGNIWLGTTSNYIYTYSTKNGFKPHKVIEKTNYNRTNNIANINLKTFTSKGLLFENGDNWYLLKNNKAKLVFSAKQVSNYKNSYFKLTENGSIFPKNTSGTYKFKNINYQYIYLESIQKHIIQFPYPNPFLPIHKGLETYYVSYNIEDIDVFNFSKHGSQFVLNKVSGISSKKNITNFITDKNNHVFLHRFNGIDKLQFATNQFKTALTSNKNTTDRDVSCRTILETQNGDIILLSYGGIYLKNKNSADWKKLALKKVKPIDYKIISNSYGAINIKPNEFLFYGSINKIIKVNLNTEITKTIEMPNGFYDIRDIIHYKDDRYLLATKLGLLEYNLKTNTFEIDNKITFAINDLLLINNSLYISSDQEGIIIKNLQANKNRYIIKANKSLISNQVKKIYKANNGDFWVGTQNGIQHLKNDFTSLKKISKQNGLVNDHIVEIQEDTNFIWASTYDGLLRINKSNYLTKTFFVENGLPHNEFNSNSSLKTSNDTIYFGTLSGALSFKANNKKIEAQPKEIFLTSYKLYNSQKNKNIETRNLLNKTPNFNVNYDKNYLTLKFAVNDIIYPEKNRFQYKINELNDQWIDLGSFNSILLEGLKPNNYNLQVKAFSSDGLSTNTKTYQIKINQIFYKKWWFILFNVLVLTAFIYWFTSYKNKKKLTLYQKNTQINELEAKAMRAQMNPHFIFNTLNGMQSVMILKGEREANKYFSAFSKLLRLTLDMNNTEHIPLKDEISYLNSYLLLENMRLNERLNYAINVDHLINIEKNTIPCMMLQPIVENALIHGLTPKKEDLKLDINFIDEHDFISVEIIDNGIGRKASAVLNEKSRKDHKSWATHIMNERIDLSNSLSKEKIGFDIIDLYDVNKISTGTKVILKIPKTFQPIKKLK